MKRYALLAGTLLLALSVLVACNNPWPLLIAPTPTSPTLPPAPTSTPIPQSAIPTPQLVILSGQQAPLSVLAWSPDGALLAASSGGFGVKDPRIRIWHRDGTPAATLTAHTDAVPALAWTSDGQLLASGSFDGSVRLWSATGTPGGMITPGAGEIFALAWAPNSRILATGSIRRTDDLTVQLWGADGLDRAALHTRFSGGKFYNLGWSADGTRLAGGATDYGLWTAEGTVLTNTFGCAHCTPAWGFAWAPNSQHWAIGNESGLITIISREGAGVAEFQSRGDVNALAWSPDSTILAGGDGVNLWQTDGTPLTSRVPIDRIASVAWSPDGQWLASGGEKGIVRLWGRDGPERGVLTGHTGPISRVAWSPDGALLASASDDGTVRLWPMGR